MLSIEAQLFTLTRLNISPSDVLLLVKKVPQGRLVESPRLTLPSTLSQTLTTLKRVSVAPLPRWLRYIERPNAFWLKISPTVCIELPSYFDGPVTSCVKPNNVSMALCNASLPPTLLQFTIKLETDGL